MKDNSISYGKLVALCVNNDIKLTTPSPRVWRLRKDGKELNIYPIANTYVFNEPGANRILNEYKDEVELVNKCFNL